METNLTLKCPECAKVYDLTPTNINAYVRHVNDSHGIVVTSISLMIEAQRPLITMKKQKPHKREDYRNISAGIFGGNNDDK